MADVGCIARRQAFANYQERCDTSRRWTPDNMLEHQTDREAVSPPLVHDSSPNSLMNGDGGWDGSVNITTRLRARVKAT